ncbi:methyltransferase family protein [Metapseudomonas otitidis]
MTQIPTALPRARWLERRIPPPLVGLACASLMYGLAQVTPGLPFALPPALRLLLALLVLAAGVAVCLAGALAFRQARTTVNPIHPERTSALVIRGIYHRTRNPMYLGFALMLLGWGLWLAAPFALAGVVLFMLYIERYQIPPEERMLEQLFGADYLAYREQVRRWL